MTRTAIVHDWLSGMRGGEKVLESLCHLLPDADLFTLFYDPHSVSETIRKRRVTTSWLDRLPGIHRHYRNFLPLFPRAVESLDLCGYDLVVSISFAVAKGANPRGARHVCYCETPLRYAWDFSGDYLDGGRVPWWKRQALRSIQASLRAWDVESSHRVNEFLANSEHVRERIKQCYNRPARVVYPPVDTDFFSPATTASATDAPYLVVSALEPHKRVDLAVAAFAASGRTLLVAGKGTLEQKLRREASANVRFLGWVTDADLRDLYRNCRALIFPGQEDFGMVPVEAQACGRPVVAYGRGGALETVLDGSTGVFFSEATPVSLRSAVDRFERLKFDPVAARRNSLRFSRQRFEEQMAQTIGITAPAGRSGV